MFSNTAGQTPGIGHRHMKGAVGVHPGVMTMITVGMGGMIAVMNIAVGHEGPGSLHSYLKHKGWISALSSGAQPLARGIAMFKVTLRLTKEGFGMLLF